ncbi:GSCFA domain-containing protein [Saprospira sp. CCB-QB6]|uniref:GSCFA domain-containing protein n=1 Tax=Saprospira sp. CCB-QB6 TaxID=3023936 RepID=UPI0023495F40|nr:GSCFA domain-containing protein [Saprospira sp. CCB-QB6]WCL80237.1 GSCFA domain-containing protein [Saprospira sp. CCB-QB6]
MKRPTPWPQALPLPHWPFSLAYRHRLMALGSCFAQEMGIRLARLAYNIDLQPFGQIYNPLSLADSLDRLLAGRGPEEEELFLHQGLYRHFAYHTDFAHPEKEVALKLMQQRFEGAKAQLLQADYLLLTLGTAYYYTYEGQLVNNCHKLPKKQFERQQMSITEGLAALKRVFRALWELNPSCQIILTVSPIRHLKDGAQGNQRSKARLLLLAEALEEEFAQLHYFPAYEILLDELRDYRFYALDRAHPTNEAVDYIYQGFGQSLLAQEEQGLREKITKLYKAFSHRPNWPDSQAHQDFLQRQNDQLAALKQAHPAISWTKWEMLLGR